jgi:hypothetical protein
MATVAKTLVSSVTGDVVVTETTLTATNDFTFTQRSGQILVLRNDTASPIECTIDGDGGSTVAVPGVGSVDVSGGFVFTVAAGVVKAINLDTIYRYLNGTISIDGEDLTAYILE